MFCVWEIRTKVQDEFFQIVSFRFTIRQLFLQTDCWLVLNFFSGFVQLYTTAAY